MEKHDIPSGFPVIVTDAVHRRLRSGKNSSDKKTEENKRDDYYCTECKVNISATNGMEDLKLHLSNVAHHNHSTCSHCSKPVYHYTYKNNPEIYHDCEKQSFFK